MKMVLNIIIVPGRCDDVVFDVTLHKIYICINKFGKTMSM